MRINQKGSWLINPVSLLASGIISPTDVLIHPHGSLVLEMNSLDLEMNSLNLNSVNLLKKTKSKSLKP
ncbi:hypothetical protein G6F68_019080 [Rhizopus microsporus]|nr:hypothetical protein G6F68_019080 [Rhizopus microsporus]